MLQSVFSWNTLWVIMWILYLPACIGLIVIVLLQKGKGSGFAGAFGVGGGSETVFGPRARKSLPVKMTYVMAAVFMILSMSMSLVAGRVHRGSAPETVAVDETQSSDAIYNELLSGQSGPAAEAPAGSPDASPAAEAEGAAPAPVAATPPLAEAPASEAPASETPASTPEAPQPSPASPGGQSQSAN